MDGLLEYGIPNWIHHNPWLSATAMAIVGYYFLATAVANTLREMDKPVPGWLEFSQTFIDKLFGALGKGIKRSLPRGDSRKP